MIVEWVGILHLLTFGMLVRYPCISVLTAARIGRLSRTDRSMHMFYHVGY